MFLSKPWTFGKLFPQLWMILFSPKSGLTAWCVWSSCCHVLLLNKCSFLTVPHMMSFSALHLLLVPLGIPFFPSLLTEILALTYCYYRSPGFKVKALKLPYSPITFPPCNGSVPVSLIVWSLSSCCTVAWWTCLPRLYWRLNFLNIGTVLLILIIPVALRIILFSEEAFGDFLLIQFNAFIIQLMTAINFWGWVL